MTTTWRLQHRASISVLQFLCRANKNDCQIRQNKRNHHRPLGSIVHHHRLARIPIFCRQFSRQVHRIYYRPHRNRRFLWQPMATPVPVLQYQISISGRRTLGQSHAFDWHDRQCKPYPRQPQAKTRSHCQCRTPRQAVVVGFPFPRTNPFDSHCHGTGSTGWDWGALLSSISPSESRRCRRVSLVVCECNFCAKHQK